MGKGFKTRGGFFLYFAAKSHPSYYTSDLLILQDLSTIFGLIF